MQAVLVVILLEDTLVAASGKVLQDQLQDMLVVVFLQDQLQDMLVMLAAAVVLVAVLHAARLAVWQCTAVAV